MHLIHANIVYSKDKDHLAGGILHGDEAEREALWRNLIG